MITRLAYGLDGQDDFQTLTCDLIILYRHVTINYVEITYTSLSETIERGPIVSPFVKIGQRNGACSVQVSYKKKR